MIGEAIDVSLAVYMMFLSRFRSVCKARFGVGGDCVVVI